VSSDGRERTRRRGVSEVVGVILLFGLVTVGIGLLVVSGTALQDDLTDESRLTTMEVTMSELNAELSTLVYQQDVDLTRLEFPSPRDQGRMEVRENVTQVEMSLNGRSYCSATVEMGAIAYVDPGGTELVYEAGGVWRIPGEEADVSAPDSVLQVQQPSLQYNGRNVSMTATAIRGDFASTAGIRAVKDVPESVERTNETEYRVLETSDATLGECWRVNASTAGRQSDFADIPEDVRLYVNVTSPYHEGWADHLEREFADDFASSEARIVDRGDGDTTVGVVLYDEDVGGFDHDGDGIPASADNCPLQFNPTQRNTDYDPSTGEGDPWGDECDPDDDDDGFPDDPRDPDNVDPADVSDPSGDYYADPANWSVGDVGAYPNATGRADDPLGNLNGDGAEYTTDVYPDEPRSPPRNESMYGLPPADNCQKVSNPEQRNWDGDTVGNRCEEDSALRDVDGDGQPDLRDSCYPKGGYNPPRPNADWVVNASEDPDKWTDQPNADHESERNSIAYNATVPRARGDACDPDDDADGVLDPWETGTSRGKSNVLGPDDAADRAATDDGDNCPRVANPDQRNLDAPQSGWHGRGDACDRDIDNDGYGNPEGLTDPLPAPNSSYEDECPFLAATEGPTNSENGTYQGCPEEWEAIKDNNPDTAFPGSAGDPDGADYDGDGSRERWKNPPYAWDEPWEDDTAERTGAVGLRCDSHDTPDRVPDKYEGDPYGLFVDRDNASSNYFDRDGDGVGPCYPSPPIEYPEPEDSGVGSSAINVRVIVFEIEADD